MYKTIKAAVLTIILLSVCVCAAWTEPLWQTHYEAGLQFAASSNWVEAQHEFEAALLDRSKDSSKPTSMETTPGLPYEWRNGSLYTPHFAAGYSAWKMAQAAQDKDVKSAALQLALTNLEALHSNGFHGGAAAYFLSAVYKEVGEDSQYQAIQNEVGMKGADVDLSVLSSSDRELVKNSIKKPVKAAKTKKVRTAKNKPTTPRVTDTTPQAPGDNSDKNVKAPIVPTTTDNSPAMQPETNTSALTPMSEKVVKPKRIKKSKPVKVKPSKEPRTDGPPQPVIGEYAPRTVVSDAPKSSVEPKTPPVNDLTAQNFLGLPRAVIPKESDRNRPIQTGEGAINGIRPERIRANGGAAVNTNKQPTNPNPGAGVTAETPIKLNNNKYALIIGNSKYSAGVGELAYPANDAIALADAFRAYGGYDKDHVTSIINATKDEILATVKSFAAQLPNDALVTVFYAGKGRNNPSDGADYIYGVDSASMQDTQSAISKKELLSPMTEQASSILSIWEVDRVSEDGKKPFGSQVPNSPRLIGIWNACATNERCYYSDAEGSSQGLFVSQFVKLLQQSPGTTFNAYDVEAKLAPRIFRVSADMNRQGQVGGTQTPPRPIPSFPGAEDLRF